MINMLKTIDKLKAYYILLSTGWRSIDVFGPPKDTMGTYIVCLKNNSVMELYYYNYDGDIRWYKLGVGDECKENPVVFWKNLPKSPYDGAMRLFCPTRNYQVTPDFHGQNGV
jgi:hypothetical protein